MVLVDWQIREAIETGTIGLDNYNPDLINANSLDIRLSDQFKHYTWFFKTPINPYHERDVTMGLTDFTGEYTINPGKFILGSTLECISLPDNLCAELTGKSSVGRLGIDIHRTAGWIDAGFSGCITLELSNAGERPVILIPGVNYHRLKPVACNYP